MIIKSLTALPETISPHCSNCYIAVQPHKGAGVGHGVMTAKSGSITQPVCKKPCIRCHGKGEIPMVARARKGGNRDGVVFIRCPACKGHGH